jgi:hypothetical protein
MKRCDWPSFDACHEDAIGIVLVLFDKVSRGLLSGNGNEWYPLVGRLEPNNLRLVKLTVLLVAARATVTMLSLSFLLFLCCLATGP